MKQSLPIIICVLLLGQMTIHAQQAVAADQTPPPSSPVAAQPSGLLTPPADNSTTTTNPVPTLAPAAPMPAATTTTTTQTTTTTSAPAASASSKPTSTSTPMTRSEVARVQQQEVIRRQELVFRARQALGTARKAELANDYPEARQNYLFAADAFGSISRATSSYADAAEGLTRVDFQLYDQACARGDTRQAKQIIDEVVKYNPNNKLANEKLLVTNRAIANPNDTSILGNPAVTPGLVKRVDKVQKLFAEAEQFRRTGQWDEAEDRLKHILSIDPYNASAAKALEIIDADKYQYAEQARMETREERLRQVEEKWHEPVNNKDLATTAQETQPSLVRSTNFSLQQKLKSIILSVHFVDASIEDATNTLSNKSKELDPEHKGINFIIQPDASASAKPVSLVLNDVPFGEVLRYVCQLAAVKFKVQDYAISIVPFSGNTEELIRRTFIVQPDFVAPPQTISSESPISAFGTDRPIAPVSPSGPATDTGTDPIKAALEAKGVDFPEGATAVYTPADGQLNVLNTADNMDMLEELVNAATSPELMVRIATKFVEINQVDLNDLTFNTTLGHVNSNSTGKNIFVSAGLATALPGSLAFSTDSIDQLINPATGASNQFSVAGAVDPVNFNLIMNALAQKSSADLLSEPAILAENGKLGEIKAIRVFPYPTDYDDPQLVTPTVVTTGTVTTQAPNPPAVIPSIPNTFKTREVGVTLRVTPILSPDKKSVALDIRPTVTDFQGFINYGSKILVVNPTNVGGIDPTSLLSNNTINQPVFNTRQIETHVLIRDGSTVVLGGLIRDDVQTINDKVPLLGDLPLIGRLFRSKAVEDTKRNLLIFVTANIYRNNGELLNPPEIANAADVLTGHATMTPMATP